MKILLCGERSFAAQGLEAVLVGAGHEVTCFSRGTVKVEGNKVEGDILAMASNPHLDQPFDIVINFILVKFGSIDQNLAFAKSLVDFCAARKVAKLFQISTISTYPNDAAAVDESTPIESSTEAKGPYASIKIAVDQYLLKHCGETKVSFLRPGFILSPDVPPPTSGILVRLPAGIHVLLGNKANTLPLVQRSRMHEAIARIAATPTPLPVYHLFENNGGTKYSYARPRFSGIIIPLPKLPIMAAAGIAKAVGIVNPLRYAQIQGLFKDTRFSSTATETALSMRFEA